MSKDKGFITVHRDIYYHDELTSILDQSVFIHMTSAATHESKKIFFKGSNIPLKRGECTYPIRDMAKKWGISRQKMRSLIDRLIYYSMISTRSARLNSGNSIFAKVTVINILNYDRYQNKFKDQHIEQPHEQPLHIANKPPIARVKKRQPPTDNPIDNTRIIKSLLETALDPNLRMTIKDITAIDQETVGYTRSGTEMPYDEYTKDSDGSKWKRHKFKPNGMEKI